MKLLAIDTSSVACTVALGVGDDRIMRHEEQPREHTRLLMPMIREVLDEASVQLSDLEAIVLGNGPGSFIGMRIAASVCQGLAHGAGIKVIPVSSLAAIAAEVFSATDARIVAVTQDAHLHEVYLGLYARRSNGLPQALAVERLHGQGVIEELKQHEKLSSTAAGEGWRRYPELYAANKSLLGARSVVRYPNARYLLQLAERSAAVAPQDIQPAYLRQKVAERPASAGS